MRKCSSQCRLVSPRWPQAQEHTESLSQELLSKNVIVFLKMGSAGPILLFKKFNP
jgi:hypothetical protein